LLPKAIKEGWPVPLERRPAITDKVCELAGSSTEPRVDPDPEMICLKCLQKEPRQRYGSAEALAEVLKCWLAASRSRRPAR
jgi:hypothetical protein